MYRWCTEDRGLIHSPLRAREDQIMTTLMTIYSSVRRGVDFVCVAALFGVRRDVPVGVRRGALVCVAASEIAPTR